MRAFSKINIGKFIVIGSTLVFEEYGTGVLKKVDLETKMITLFDAFCSDESQLPVPAFGLFVAGNVLYHSWGGKLRRFYLNYSRPIGSTAKFSRAYLERPRAILLEDEDHGLNQPNPTCEHLGYIYYGDKFTLMRQSRQGQIESTPLYFSIACLTTCRNRLIACDLEGVMYFIDTTNFISPEIKVCENAPKFTRPKQVLEHESNVYVLDSRGIWIMGTNTFIQLPHVMWFAVSSKNDKIELVCSEFNTIYTLKI